jgi:Fe-S-cluster containining protein
MHSASAPARQPRSPEERSALCLGCGLCCQGVLHDLVPLGEDELERAERLRLPVVESPHRLAFRLPCPRLEERRCTVYAERPRTCADYACETLRAYGAGEIDEATALGRIRGVREQSALVAGLPGGLARDEARAELSRMRRTWFDP